MLQGIKILEFQGLAPSIFCGMYFADQGAEVILVTRPEPAPFSMPIHKNIMNRNKKSIILSLKGHKDKQILTKLIKNFNIIIDPYRPGVLQKQGFGPEQLYKINPKIILLRVTGFGQIGKTALKPGHDLNYISSSGILSLINEKKDQYKFPANILADFVAVSFGILDTLTALKKVQESQSGFIVDCSLAGGCSYLTQLVTENKQAKFEKEYNQNKVEYLSLNGKRYLITKSKNKIALKKDQIIQIIRKLQNNKQVYFKDQTIQIAEILPVQKIKQSNLINPFCLNEYKHNLKNSIPKRDYNRQQILKQYKINQINPKL